MNLPAELWLHIFEYLHLAGLLSCYRVNRVWRALVPNIKDSIHLKFFNLALGDIAQPSNMPHTVSLRDRLSYVRDIEEAFGVLIPEPYCSCLTEWPIKRPPPRFHWPHSVRFHASGFCSCIRESHENKMCLCHEERLQTVSLV